MWSQKKSLRPVADEVYDSICIMISDPVRFGMEIDKSKNRESFVDSWLERDLPENANLDKHKVRVRHTASDQCVDDRQVQADGYENPAKRLPYARATYIKTVENRDVHEYVIYETAMAVSCRSKSNVYSASSTQNSRDRFNRFDKRAPLLEPKSIKSFASSDYETPSRSNAPVPSPRISSLAQNKMVNPSGYDGLDRNNGYETSALLAPDSKASSGIRNVDSVFRR